MHWIGMIWAERSFWIRSWSILFYITCQRLYIERTAFSVCVCVFFMEIMWGFKDSQSTTSKFIYCFSELWNNAWCPILTEFEERNPDKSANIGTLMRWHRTRILRSIRLFKKSNTVDTPMFGNWDESRNHRQRIHCRMPKKFYHCSFKGCLGIIFMYITYIFTFIYVKPNSTSHTVLWWFNRSSEIHFENHNKCHICTAY